MEGISPTLKHGTPTDDELEELGAVIEQKWRKLGRRLHVSDESLDEIDLKTRTELSEKGYHMLKLWKETEGSAATYEVLCHALKHNLVHREDLAEKFCYINGPPTIQLYASPVQEERETGEVLCASAGTYVGGASGKDQDNSSGVRSGLKRKMLELNSELVKRGTPTDDELEGLGYKITGKWKKLGRRLHVSNSMLQEIDQAHAELSEKGYYMLMHWKETGSAATYKVLSDALKHEFVQRHDLARKYCYVNGYLPWKIDCASATSRISEEQDPEVKRKKVDRCMKQKVDETKEKFDLSSFAGLHDFYVHLVGELQLTNVNFYGSSITITVQCCTLEILERLWDYYCSGHLNEVAEKCLITEKVLEELGMQTIKLKTTILEEDYLACRLSLMQISNPPLEN